MSHQASVIGLSAAAIFLLAAGTASASDFEPLDDMISARVGGVVTGFERDEAYQHSYETGAGAWLRLQFGARFGKTAHCALAWEPRLGVVKSSTDAEGTFTGITPFEILGGAWLKLGKNRGLVRAGYYWDYGSYLMTRARFDWGGGAVESTFSFGHSLRLALAYRLRVADHFVLMAELRGERYKHDATYAPAPVERPNATATRPLADFGAESLLAFEWALDGE